MSIPGICEIESDTPLFLRVLERHDRCLNCRKWCARMGSRICVGRDEAEFKSVYVKHIALQYSDLGRLAAAIQLCTSRSQMGKGPTPRFKWAPVVVKSDHGQSGKQGRGSDYVHHCRSLLSCGEEIAASLSRPPAY